MWRSNEIKVKKMGKRTKENFQAENLSVFIGSYPHNEDLKTCRIWLNESFMKIVHISTALIVLINFYI